MADKIKTGNVAHSVPCSPITTSVHVEPFLHKTPVPSIQEKTLKWVKGAPTPIQEGQLTPNSEALNLLTGFATGEISMEGEQLKHLPSISESLETLWETPKRKKNIDGSASHTKKAKIAQKEPRKNISKQLAKQNPCTKIPDSGIKIENIIQGSPVYIPYKWKIPKSKGKGKGSKGSKLKVSIKSVQSESVDMAHTKQTLTKAEMDAIKARNKKARV